MGGRTLLGLLSLSLTACALVASIDDITVSPDDTGDASVPDTGSPEDTGTPPVPDSGNDTAPPNDGGVLCTGTTAFGAPVAIAEVNSVSNDISATLTSDELTLFLASDRAGHIGGGSIYTATRATKTSTFGVPVLATNVNNTNNTTVNPSITGNGLELFVQITVGASIPHLYMSTRALATDPFGAPVAVVNVNSGASDFVPFVTSDGTGLYFASNRNISTEFVLYQSLAVAGVFGAATVVPGIATGANPSADTSPVLSSDLMTIYFASEREDSVYHIYEAHRTTPTGTFAMPTAVTQINSPVGSGIADLPNWLSPDGCRLYMTRGAATGDIYVATRTP